MKETHAELELEDKIVIPGKATGGKEVGGDAGIGSALDLLVQAMKKRRDLVPELAEMSPEMTIKDQVAVAATAMHEKDPAGDKVIESAVDVLIQAMKIRRTSTMEL
jgi:hypothetical protein